MSRNSCLKLRLSFIGRPTRIRGTPRGDPRGSDYRARVAQRTTRRPKAMTDEEGLRDRMTRQGEEAIGKLAQELLENPMISSALSAAFETRERRSEERRVGKEG